MPVKARQNAGFTLVEILIVVTILGILAALVIPQVSQASDSARSSTLKSQLQTVRAQLQLYQTQHAGSFPTLAQLQADWGVMTAKTDISGSIVTGGNCGPYLLLPPKNPVQESASVASTPAYGVGWVYDETQGQLTACVPASKVVALGLFAADVSTY